MPPDIFKEANMKTTEETMEIVMAVLNTSGVAYDTSKAGHSSKREMSKLLMSDDVIVDFDGNNFQSNFVNFISTRHYDRYVKGRYWSETENPNYVVVQLSRSYDDNENDWKNWANEHGCKSILEAQYFFGKPHFRPLTLNVRISTNQLQAFTKKVAGFCW